MNNPESFSANTKSLSFSKEAVDTEQFWTRLDIKMKPLHFSLITYLLSSLCWIMLPLLEVTCSAILKLFWPLPGINKHLVIRYGKSSLVSQQSFHFSSNT